MRWICLVLAALCTACGQGGENRPADMIIVNGKVFTGVPEAGDAQAVAIRDGRILAVGTEEEVRDHAGRKTAIIDAGGRRIVPGLTDAHAHFSARPDGVELQVGSGPTPDPAPQAVLDAVAAEARVPDGRGWIFVTIGPAALDDKSLRRDALDTASPARPVMLVAHTGHGTILNTRGMKVLDVNEDLDPPGGWCERDGAGVCTGLIREMTEFAARRKLRMSTSADKTVEAYRQAANAYLRWGVTAVDEMALSHTVARTVSALTGAGVPIRWSIYRAPMLKGSMDEAWTDDYSGLKLPDNIRLAGVKWILDGTPIERDAALRSDYADRKDWKGRLDFTTEELQRLLKEGFDRNEQLALHAAGDRTLETVFAMMRDIAPAEKWRARRLRIEHGDGLDSDLVKQAQELGVVVVQNPLRFADIPQISSRLSKEERASFQLVGTWMKQGGALALGSDAGGEGRNPFLNIMVATAHPLNPDEALSVRQALAAYTRGGAYAEKREEERGTLEPGKLADLAILSQDIFEVPVEQLPATSSVLTMIGGEVVYRTDKIAGLPEKK